MNDMDLLASFRAEAPERPVSTAAEHRFHTAFHQAKRRLPVSRASRLLLHPRRMLLVPLAISAAAALVLALVTGHTGISAPPAASTGQASLTVRLVADRAATSALDQPAVRPGQWVYRLIQVKTAYSPSAQNSTETTWATASGVPGEVNGATLLPKLPTLAYAQLASLPSDPAALERYLADQRLGSFGSGYITRPAATAFELIRGLFWNYALPPKLTAELYRALADIPGVTVNTSATDIAGRHGIAFELANIVGHGSYAEIILNPSDYALMAVGSRGSTSTAVARQTGQLAVLRQAFVSRPGVRG